MPSFAERSRSLLRQLLAMGQTRLEMLGLAVEQEVHALGRELRLAAVCIIAAWLAGTSAVLWIALVFPRQVGLWILGILCLLFAVTSLVTWQALKRAARRERVFSRLAEQLRQDAKALESFTGTEHD
ncbi:MAG TPA: phage holin family protein [Steroidobacteraceae bacterium]|nr:phage holin family protein [Steroidobacteraceae bacterium]